MNEITTFYDEITTFYDELPTYGQIVHLFCPVDMCKIEYIYLKRATTRFISIHIQYTRTELRSTCRNRASFKTGTMNSTPTNRISK